jgi:hypothetical protein
MTDKDKQQYEAKATKDKERYEAEKRAYHVRPLYPILMLPLTDFPFVGLKLYCPPRATKPIKTPRFCDYLLSRFFFSQSISVERRQGRVCSLFLFSVVCLKFATCLWMMDGFYQGGCCRDGLLCFL